MGLLIDGVWRDRWYDTQATGGRFVRPRTSFRNWVTPDGAVGPSGVAGFAAAAQRYHLYVSLACPWAHRTLNPSGVVPVGPAVDFGGPHDRARLAPGR